MQVAATTEPTTEAATSEPTASEAQEPEQGYVLKVSMPLYAQCVNLTQDFVTEDPKPKLVKRLPVGTSIVAVEPGWSQIGVNSVGSIYRYSRDEQTIRVRSADLDGCISFQDTDTDAGDVRDAGLQKYLDATMTSAKDNPEITSGSSPTTETIDNLDSRTHYSSVDAIDAAEGSL